MPHFTQMHRRLLALILGLGWHLLDAGLQGLLTLSFCQLVT